MIWRREDYPLLPLCCAQAGESETSDGRLKSQRKGRGDKKKRSSAVTKDILGEEHLNHYHLSGCSLAVYTRFILWPFYTRFRPCVVYTLSGRTGSALTWHSEGRTSAAPSVQQVLRFLARIALCNTWSSGGTALCRVGGATSQLDLPYLTPLSIAGCG